MRDDHGLTIEWLTQRVGKPRARALVSPDSICRIQFSIRRRRSNQAEIAHRALCISHANHGRDVVAVEPEIRPERTAQKTDITQHQSVVLQNVDVGAACGLAKLVQREIEVPPVELVISGHQDDRLCRIGNERPSPLNASILCVDITRQYDDIGTGDGLRVSYGRFKFIVQIGQYEQFHDFTLKVLIANRGGRRQITVFYSGR